MPHVRPRRSQPASSLLLEVGDEARAYAAALLILLALRAAERSVLALGRWLHRRPKLSSDLALIGRLHGQTCAMILGLAAACAPPRAASPRAARACARCPSAARRGVLCPGRQQASSPVRLARVRLARVRLARVRLARVRLARALVESSPGS